MNTVDARNIPCPGPVVKTKNALEQITDEQFIVLVNSPEACENVQRYAKSQGCSVSASENEGEFTITVTRGEPVEVKETESADVILITSDKFGSGDDELGELLMASFINALPDVNRNPARMLFVNSGVMLTTEGSRVLNTLQQLEKEGVEIFSCGTCLTHYQLKEKLEVGKVTNMYDTIESLLTAGKVVRI